MLSLSLNFPNFPSAVHAPFGDNVTQLRQRGKRKQSHFRFATYCLLIYVAGCGTLPSNKVTNNNLATNALYRGFGFTMEVPSLLAVHTQRLVDSDIYSVDDSATGKNILFLYVGHNPEFPKAAPKTISIHHARIGGRAARIMTWTTRKGFYSKEMLITINTMKELSAAPNNPMYIQCIYYELDKPQAYEAETIITSIRRASETAQPVKIIGK